MPKSEYNYSEWFQKADEDEKSISAILNGEGAPSTACFLAQQMAEKYLKGLLIFHGKNFRKVHDLLELEMLLMKVEKDIPFVHKDLNFLNRFYIETRYPGDYPEFSFQEAKEAYRSAHTGAG